MFQAFRLYENDLDRQLILKLTNAMSLGRIGRQSSQRILSRTYTTTANEMVRFIHALKYEYPDSHLRDVLPEDINIMRLTDVAVRIIGSLNNRPVSHHQKVKNPYNAGTPDEFIRRTLNSLIMHEAFCCIKEDIQIRAGTRGLFLAECVPFVRFRAPTFQAKKTQPNPGVFQKNPGGNHPKEIGTTGVHT